MMIELVGLTKTYSDGTRALAPLDLTLEEGVLGLLGPNGAGKTTLLEMIVLALEPSGGRRRYFGLDDGAANRRRIRPWLGYLPQELEVVSSLTGREYLILCGQLRAVPLGARELEARVWRLLEAVGLTDAAHRATGGYSGGMIRRLGLAQALIHSPRLLVVDEPTAGLDPEERLQFRGTVTEIGDRIPVLLSTHIVEDIEATCPRIGILEEGELIFDGPPSELFRRAEGRVWSVPAEATMSATPIGQRAASADMHHLLVLGDSPPTAEARPVEPSLEEAYAAFLTDYGSSEERALQSGQ